MRKKQRVAVSRRYSDAVRLEDSASVLSVPDEVLRRCTLITALGQREITVEGHEGILTYETALIRIRTREAVIAVCGSELVIDYYNDEELKIVGCIGQISWESR